MKKLIRCSSCDHSHRPPGGSRCNHTETAKITAISQGVSSEKWPQYLDVDHMEEDNARYMQESESDYNREARPDWVNELVNVNREQSNRLLNYESALSARRNVWICYWNV